MLPMKCKETVCRYIFVGTPETPIVSASSPFSVFRPMASPILEWNTHREAPESIISLNFLQGGECFAGFEIWSAGVWVQISNPGKHYPHCRKFEAIIDIGCSLCGFNVMIGES